MTAKRTIAIALIALAPLALLGDRARGGGERQDEARALDRVLPKAVARAARSVVRIHPAGLGIDGTELARKTRTGVAIAPDLVLSDALSVATFGTDDLVVETLDGKIRKARLRGRDLRLRIVALVVDGGGLAPITTSRRPVEAGRLALALGAVLGGAQPSATFGIVSATSRFEGRAIETDATIDPSNAGGPLVDVEGDALGVNVVVDRRIGDGSGVGFAVPFARIAPFLERLRKGDEIEQGFLGVVLPTELPPGREGVPIEAVRPQGPAAKAGVRAGDVVVAIDGARVATPHELVTRLACAAAGDVVRLTIRRGVEARAFDVKLVSRDAPR